MYYTSREELVLKLLAPFALRAENLNHLELPAELKGLDELLTESITEDIEQRHLPYSYGPYDVQHDVDSLIDGYRNNLVMIFKKTIEEEQRFHIIKPKQSSLLRAISSLCPLWPFLKEPCSNYN